MLIILPDCLAANIVQIAEMLLLIVFLSVSTEKYE